MAKLSDILPPKKTCENCGNYMCIDLCINRDLYIDRCLSRDRRRWLPKEDDATDTDGGGKN